MSDDEKIAILDDVISWHKRRAEFFSHGGSPWGAMAHQSAAIVKVVEAAIQSHESLRKELGEIIEHWRELYAQSDRNYELIECSQDLQSILDKEEE